MEEKMVKSAKSPAGAELPRRRVDRSVIPVRWTIDETN